MKEIITYQLSIKVAGKFRTSPEYTTPEEACANIVPFLTKLQQRYTVVTVVRNVRHVVDEAAK